MKNSFKVLVADDEPSVRELLKNILEDSGVSEILEAEDGQKALSLIKSEAPDLVFLDIKMPRTDGMSVLRELSGEGKIPRIIVITAFGDFSTALQAMGLGAFDYLNKPFNIEEIKNQVSKAMHLKELEEEVRSLKGKFPEAREFREQIVGRSEKMLEIIKTVGRIAPSPVTVLIIGESGTGKELIARAIHGASPRRERLFLPVNCAAIPETLLESELFGYEKGSFTGAQTRTPGKFELADGGTVFLDEIGDMSLSLQAKVLRVLQDKTFMRIGGKEPVTVDVRVIAATNQDIEEMVRDGRFREDLYFRLNVCLLKIPPLRERREDIEELAYYFLEKYSQEYSREVKGFTPEAIEKLLSYSWPGNVRELENSIARAVASAKAQVLTPEDFPLSEKPPEKGEIPLIPLAKATEELEKRLIKEALEVSGGNQTQAARILQISRQTLSTKIKQYGIKVD
ncbi:MAG: sigma-54 dependent transcriptional regulator [Caldiserica bacterium]|nr:sigma-54 dependent transcriptional regulator [Caldisericota bacterium]MDH7562102.1 sigma-54 dependent transcriptional regulator [Caldisericota bacterium]